MDSGAITSLHLTDPGKRRWEMSKLGYLNWAAEQLLERSSEPGRGKRAREVSQMEGSAVNVGSVEDLRAALDAMENIKGFKLSLEAMHKTP